MGKGREWTPEQKAKLSATLKRIGHRPPHASGELHPMYGRKHTPEALAKISRTSKGRPSAKGMLGKRQTAAARAAISRNNLGKHSLSPLHRQKLIAAATGPAHYNWKGGISKGRHTRAVYRRNYRARKRASNGSHKPEEWASLKAAYNYCCLSCGRSEPEIRLEADHVKPLALGGDNTISNIQPLCTHCNRTKSMKNIDYRPLWPNVNYR
jgi:5-methylcytosine-specific restriction endonuclease McrA